MYQIYANYLIKLTEVYIMNNEQLILDQIGALKSIDYLKGKNTYLQEIDAIEKRIKDDVFRIAVVGEFSSGKSTFINSLIGKDVLSHAVSETTATITNIVNVDKNDNRLQTCDITYRNGEKLHLNNLDDLMKYTTAQSNANVAEKISTVSVYVNFMDISYPLVITDTPGLNGHADLHREITIDEIKKAHACIYVLSLKGLTDSDVDFIKLLLNYQNRFIFVQNFIDALRSTEGETLEGKLNDVSKNLDMINQKIDEDGAFGYKLVGISALKALVSKDDDIKRLYADSIEELSEDDRKKLYAESNIKEFEDLLENLFTSGEYKEYTICSAAQAINKLIEKVYLGLNSAHEIERFARKNLSNQNRIDKFNELITKKNEKKEEIRRQLNNFMDSQNRYFKKNLKEFTRDKLNDINKEVCLQIDKEILCYDDLIGNPNSFKYFAEMATNRINTSLIPDISKRMISNFNHLYEDAIVRIQNSLLITDENKFSVNVSANENFGDLTVKVDQTNGIEQKTAELNVQKKRLPKYEKTIQESRKKDIQLQHELAQTQNAEEKIQAGYEYAIKELGRKPEITEKKEKHTRQVSRGGFFGAIIDFFGGKKTETYYVTVTDDSEQQKWLKKKRRLDSEFELRKSELTKKINDLTDQINKNKRENDVSQMEKKRLENSIANLENQIQEEKKVYEEIINNRKADLCRTRKEQIKKSIEEQLLGGENNNDSIFIKITDHIEKSSENYLADVRKKVIGVFEDDYNKVIKHLEEMRNENQNDIDRRLEASERDKGVLKSITNALKII